MSVFVPGIGEVPVRWLPATRPEDYARTRFGLPVVAIVHHRIVGTLAGADATFAASDADPATAGARDRNVSATFAIGIIDGAVEVHQYVDLSDTHFCNGDYNTDSRWDEWHGARRIDIGAGVSIWNTNPQTVSIEHHDNGGSADPERKGIVPERVVKASIALDRLMLAGDVGAIRSAGIHCRDEATAKQLGAIEPEKRTLIDHHDIAGPFKPTCWRPWAADEVGFPRARYVEELTDVVSPDAKLYSQAEADVLVAAAVGPLNVAIGELSGNIGAAGARLREAEVAIAGAKASLDGTSGD